MGIFDNFKEKLAWYYLRRDYKSVVREKKLLAYGKAIAVGILCEYREDEFIKLEKFYKNLQEEGKKVRVLAYFDKQSAPVNVLPRLSLDFYSDKDMNWNGRPKVQQVLDFTNEDFDYLIDTTKRSIQHITYVIATSKAKMKIGSRESELERGYYDIHIKADQNFDAHLSNIIHYLSIIKGNGTN